MFRKSNKEDYTQSKVYRLIIFAIPPDIKFEYSSLYKLNGQTTASN